MEKLPYFEIAKSGYRVVYYNWQNMARLGLVPFVIIFVLAILNAILSRAVMASAAGGNPGAAAGLSFLILLLTLAWVASIVPFLVAWHRFTIDVADKRMPTSKVTVGKKELLYFAYMIAYGIAIAIIYSIGIVLGGILLGFLFTLGMLYLAMRFAFIFPEIALGRRTDPAKSWRQTAKDHVELWLLGIALLIPMIVVAVVINTIAAGTAAIPFLGIALAIVLQIVGMAIYIAFLASFTSALTLAYKRIVID